MRIAIVAVVVGLALLVPSAAHAQVQHHCRSVTAGHWQATGISAYNMGCQSTRSKLRRWLRRGHLPHEGKRGWDCRRTGRLRRQCITYRTRTGDPAGFRFTLYEIVPIGDDTRP